MSYFSFDFNKDPQTIINEFENHWHSYEWGGRSAGKTHRQKEHMSPQETWKDFIDYVNSDTICYNGITANDDYLHNEQWLKMLRSFPLDQQQNILLAWRKERRRIRLKNIYQLWPTQVIQLQ